MHAKRTLLLVGVLALASMTLAGCSVPKSTVRGQTHNGLFAIICEPDDAMVYVDGQLVGKASKFDGKPGYLEIASGTHRLEVKADGYAPFVRDVYSSNTAQTIRVTLVKLQ